MSEKLRRFHSGGLDRRRFLAGTGIAGLAALYSAACGGSGSSGDAPSGAGASRFNQANTQVTTEQPSPGGKISLHITSDPANLDYQTQTTPVFWTLYANRLLKYKTGSEISPNQYELTPDLAASWEASEGTRITFKLNRAAKFHDKAPVNGRAVTSEDVKQTFTYLNTNKPDYLFRYLVDYIDAIETPGPDTVTLRLKTPTPLVTTYLAYYNAAIAPAEVFARDGNLQKNDIGSGPFLFSKQEKSVGYSFSKNPSYFGAGRPYVDGVEVSVLADANAALDAFRTGKLDAMDISFDQLDAAQKTLPQETTTLQTQPGVGWFALWFNAQRPPFKDARVRQAFQYAVDRTAVNALVTRGQGQIRTGPISRGWTQWSRSDAEVQADAKRDVAKAKQLLAAAGLDKGLKVDFMAISSHISGANGNLVQVVQQQLKEAGIEITIAPVDRPAGVQRLSTQDFDLAQWSIRAYPDPDDYLSPFFLSGGSKNFGGTDDPALTALIEKQRNEVDPAKRAEVLREIDRRWMSEFAYALWAIELPYAHAYQKRLRNYSGRNPTDYVNLETAFIKNG